MNPETAERVGRAAAYVLRQSSGDRSGIVIGRDTRLSGAMLEDALTAGICSMGMDVIKAGVLPTPAVAFLTVDQKAAAGAVISASHNPYEDNGLKFFAGDGFKLPDETEARIERLIFSDELDSLRAPADKQGRVLDVEDAGRRYIDFLKGSVPKDITFKGLRIVADCANGAASSCGPTVFEELGAEVTVLGVEPDGRNINLDCGSLYPDAAVAKVLEMEADCGLALDGDADRVIFIDHEGNVVDGDRIMALIARDLHSRERLAKGTVVATIMSNLGLELALKGMGLNLVRTDVGDRYVSERMRQGGYNFGGEQSGHLIFFDHSTTGDGLMSALQVLTAMVSESKPLAELAGIMQSVPQVLISEKVARRVNLEDIPEIRDQYRLVRQHLGNNGRLVVRYSGTEPKVRIMIEGSDIIEIKALAEETAACIVKALR